MRVSSFNRCANQKYEGNNKTDGTEDNFDNVDTANNALSDEYSAESEQNDNEDVLYTHDKKHPSLEKVL